MFGKHKSHRDNNMYRDNNNSRYSYRICIVLSFPCSLGDQKCIDKDTNISFMTKKVATSIVLHDSMIRPYHKS